MGLQGAYRIQVDHPANCTPYLVARIATKDELEIRAEIVWWSPDLKTVRHVRHETEHPEP